MSKPNVIFLMTDQHRWDCLGVENSQVKTPNLDKLAREGIRFRQAVCQCPMCVPSRNSMMFGYYPSQLGVRSNGGGLFYEDRLPSLPLPELMKREGYQTAGFGKTHWNHAIVDSEPSTRGFEVRAGWGVSEGRLYEKGGTDMSDVVPEGEKAYMEEVEEYGRGGEQPEGYRGCTSNVPPEHHPDGFHAHQCLEFLENDLDSGRPLFLYLSFFKPHAGFNVPEKFENMYDIDEIPDIPQPPWDKEEKNHLAEARKQQINWEQRYQGWKQVWEEMTPQERKRTTLRYWANCSWLDDYFGQVLVKLKEKGILDNSLIIFTSDHGEMLGERNFLFSKYCLFDSSVRVPLILSGSVISQEKRGTIDDRPAELVDLLPTIIEQTTIDKNPMLPGVDLLSETKKSGGFCEFYGGSPEGFGTPSYMWRKKDWKLILYLPGDIKTAISRLSEVKGELYNLKEDKHEWDNLYYNDEYREMREQLKTELLMHLASCWSKGPFFY
ncbi:MAG: sulfatase, partial [Bacillota bacterium]